jgi:GT2 family glycosyltransferase
MIRRGLTIGIPFTGRKLVPEWGWTFAQLRWPMNVDLRYERAEGMEVGDARNQLAESALLAGSRWLFFLDEDVVPPLSAVKQLIQAMDERPDAAMIGAIYSDKTEPCQPMVFDEAGAGPFWDWDVGEVFRVRFGVATGCSLIDVRKLEDIPRPWFRTVDGQAERWTEDMWFCRQVRESGSSVYAHGGILCRHYNLGTGKAYFLDPHSKPFRKFHNQNSEVP